MLLWRVEKVKVKTVLEKNEVEDWPFTSELLQILVTKVNQVKVTNSIVFQPMNGEFLSVYLYL